MVKIQNFKRSVLLTIPFASGSNMGQFGTATRMEDQYFKDSEERPCKAN